MHTLMAKKGGRVTLAAPSPRSPVVGADVAQSASGRLQRNISTRKQKRHNHAFLEQDGNGTMTASNQKAVAASFISLLEDDGFMSKVVSAIKTPAAKRTNKQKTVVKELVMEVPFFKGAGEDGAKKLSKHVGFLAVGPNEMVIREGDVGDLFYVTLRGSVAVWQKPNGWLQDTEPAASPRSRNVEPQGPMSEEDMPKILGKMLVNLHAGTTFGELALLEDNGKRAASIVTMSKCSFITFSRFAFNEVVKTFIDRKQAKLLGAILSVSALKKLSYARLARLAYTLKPVSFLPRGVLAAQGDKVEHLFLVTSGEVTCARRLAHDGKKGLGKKTHMIQVATHGVGTLIGMDRLAGYDEAWCAWNQRGRSAQPGGLSRSTTSGVEPKLPLFEHQYTALGSMSALKLKMTDLLKCMDADTRERLRQDAAVTTAWRQGHPAPAPTEMPTMSPRELREFIGVNPKQKEKPYRRRRKPPPVVNHRLPTIGYPTEWTVTPGRIGAQSDRTDCQWRTRTPGEPGLPEMAMPVPSMPAPALSKMPWDRATWNAVGSAPARIATPSQGSASARTREQLRPRPPSRDTYIASTFGSGARARLSPRLIPPQYQFIVAPVHGTRRELRKRAKSRDEIVVA